jgi:hypothetical protein
MAKGFGGLGSAVVSAVKKRRPAAGIGSAARSAVSPSPQRALQKRLDTPGVPGTSKRTAGTRAMQTLKGRAKPASPAPRRRAGSILKGVGAGIKARRTARRAKFGPGLRRKAAIRRGYKPGGTPTGMAHFKKSKAAAARRKKYAVKDRFG